MGRVMATPEDDTASNILDEYMLALEDVPTRINNPQKLCDIADWCDQRLDYIIRHHLRVDPIPKRRQWEFAMIFLALAREGKLRPEAVGLGLGVGTERLIFSLARMVRHVVATDLYAQDSKWVGVRTADPKSHVLRHAPFYIDPARLDVHAMDMRAITYPDDSFDFAWSTGSFEHIGGDDDFVCHLREVHRALKPGGIYAFTTAISFSDDSVRIPGNHYFSPQHLLDLIDQCPLHPEPEFDVSLVETRFNQPMTDRPQDLGLSAAKSWLPQVIILRRGTVSAANLVLLRKDDAQSRRRARIVGWEKSRDFVDRSLRTLLEDLWSDWQNVSAEMTHDGEVAEGALAFKTQPQFLGQAGARVCVLLKAQSADSRGCTLDVMVVERRKGWPLAKRVVAVEHIIIKKLEYETWHEVKLGFQADEHNCYYVQARPRKGPIQLQRALVWLRRDRS